MCCFFIHFHPVVPDMEKAELKSRFPLKFTGPTYRRAN